MNSPQPRRESSVLDRIGCCVVAVFNQQREGKIGMGEREAGVKGNGAFEQLPGAPIIFFAIAAQQLDAPQQVVICR